MRHNFSVESADNSPHDKMTVQSDDIVAVITPTHNSQETIIETLSSISNQTYPHFKVYVVDDHSTDNTKKLITDFCKKDKRFQLISLQKQSGAAAARNEAIKQIQKDNVCRYIAFLDGDDIWEPKKLAIQVAFMKKSGAKLSYGDYYVINPKYPQAKRCRKAPKKVTYFKMLLGCSIGCLTVMYDNNALKKSIIIPNLRKRNDYALWCIILKQIRHGEKYPGVLATYRKNNGISAGHKISLMKYHYQMHRQVNGFNPVLSFVLMLTNSLNYLGNITFRERKT